MENEVFRYSLYQLAHDINEQVINVTLDNTTLKVHWNDGISSVANIRGLNKLGIARKLLGLL